VVTFRFYVVSIVAFFLALAVGVVVGSVLDGRIADGLQDRLDGVEASLDETVAAMDAKKVEIDRLERYVEASAPFAVESQLTETSALVVAESGVDEEPIEDLVRRLREAGSSVEGIVWLEPDWDLRDPEDLTAARAIAGLSTGDAETVREAIWENLAASAGIGDGATELTTTTTAAPDTTAPVTDPTTGEPTETTPSTTAPTTTVNEVPTSLFEASPLAELASAGLVRLEKIDSETDLAGGTPLLVAATGLDSDLRSPGAATAELVRSSAGAGIASVLAEITVEPSSGEREQRGTLVAAARDEGGVQFSTVDDLELIAGRVASVLALAQVRDGVIGRYGYGPDVDGVLPAWRGP